MGLIRDSNRLCQECALSGQSKKATNALIIPGEMRWWVCDDCARRYSEALFNEGFKIEISQGIDGRIASFRKK